MANDSTPGFLSNPLPLIAILLLAAGLLVRTLPLESARPGDADRAHPSIADTQDVPARLWQDPFAAVNAAKALAAKDGATARPNHLRDPKTLREQIESFVERSGQPVQILGVMASTSAFAEDAEARRRERYAVVQALTASGYVPFDPEGLGYLEISDAQSRKLPARVPFEWFVSEDSGAGGKSGKSRVLLLWLEENVLGWRPPQRIARLIQTICGEAVSLCKDGLLQKQLVFIGPGSSAGLATLSDHMDMRIWNEGKERWPSLGRYRFDFYSPFATNPADKLPLTSGHEACVYPNRFTGTQADCPIRILRTIGGDDRLAHLVSEELALRGVNGEGWACNDRVVIVAERDTTYGRELAKQFREALAQAPACDGKQSTLIWDVGYLRGLDGAVAETSGDKASTAKRDNGPFKVDIDSLDSPEALRERAEGRSQFDYVRRLALQIREHEQSEDVGSTMLDYLRLEGAPKIKAIGVLGNDVYDKLLILQALHQVFPYAIFFTTDLDARLLHPDQSEWTRNLLVAGNYGFNLRRELQGSTPPFRNGYQTSAYLATLMAMQNLMDNADTATLNKRLSQWHEPSVYELGRTQPVLLRQEKSTALGENACNPTALMDCENVQVQKILPAHSVGLALVAMLAGLALLLMSSQAFYRKAKQHYLWAISVLGMLALCIVILAGRLLRPLVADLIEPFAWFEGVSLWPSLLFFLFAGIAALTSILYISRAFRRAKDSMTLEFFPSSGEMTSGEQAWLNYDKDTYARSRLLRALPISFVCFLFFISIILLGKHQLPFRGEAVWICSVILISLSGFLLLYLAFQVLDIVRHTTRFLEWLATCDTQYPTAVHRRYAEEIGFRDCGSGACTRDRLQVLENWIDFGVVVRLTTEVERFIYFPFFVLLVFALGQIRLFDDWQISPSILVVVAVFVAYVMYCSYSLRQAAEMARSRSLAHYNACLLRSAGGDELPCGPVRLIEALITRIRDTRAGAFRPFFQRPALKSLLIPFGGMGGYSIVEYLFMRGV
ncbi:MAG TPA: hypothetical protein VJU83_01455 [Burkholderiales bacterium]|nr:hypothetical protein [Burkholderiales bacterium]